MKVGDVVKLRPFYALSLDDPTTKVFGIILDEYEDNNGSNWYKVQFDPSCEWYADYELELISETQSVDG